MNQKPVELEVEVTIEQDPDEPHKHWAFADILGTELRFRERVPLNVLNMKDLDNQKYQLEQIGRRLQRKVNKHFRNANTIIHHKPRSEDRESQDDKASGTSSI